MLMLHGAGRNIPDIPAHGRMGVHARPFHVAPVEGGVLSDLIVCLPPQFGSSYQVLATILRPVCLSRIILRQRAGDTAQNCLLDAQGALCHFRRIETELNLEPVLRIVSRQI